MNRKILLALIALPVLVFGADKALGGVESGGKQKEKAKKELARETPPQVEAAAKFEHAEDVTPAAVEKAPEAPLREVKSPPKKRNAKVSKSAKVKRASRSTKIDALEANQQALEEAYIENDYNWVRGEDLGDRAKKFLDRKVKRVLTAENPGKFRPSESFSRCASGYRYAVQEISEDKTRGSGWLIIDSGCWDRPMANFNFNVAKGMVSVKLADNIASVSIKEFCSLYEKAEIEM